MDQSPLTMITTCLKDDDLRFGAFLSMVRARRPIVVYFFACDPQGEMFVKRLVQLNRYSMTMSAEPGVDPVTDTGLKVVSTSDGPKLHVHFCKSEYKNDAVSVPLEHNIIFFTPMCAVETYSKLIDLYYYSHITRMKAVFFARDLELMQCHAEASKLLGDESKQRFRDMSKYVINKRSNCAIFDSAWQSRDPAIVFRGPMSTGVINAQSVVNSADREVIVTPENKLDLSEDTDSDKEEYDLLFM